MPLDKYRRYITDDLSPFTADEEVAILGHQHGALPDYQRRRINEEQVESIRQRLCPSARR